MIDLQRIQILLFTGSKNKKLKLFEEVEVFKNTHFPGRKFFLPSYKIALPGRKEKKSFNAFMSST